MQNPPPAFFRQMIDQVGGKVLLVAALSWAAAALPGNRQ
jgi:hypothetical protein